MNNWNTTFKQSFLDLALNYGDAGEIIITGRDRPLREPRMDDVQRVPVERDEDEERLDDANEEDDFEDQRVYGNNAEGRKEFREDHRIYLKLKNEKQKLLSKLLSLMERDVRDKLVATDGYERALREFDVLKIWLLTEQVVRGRGAVSIYTMTSRLVTLKQVDKYKEYNSYLKEFKDVRSDLMRQGTAAQVLDKIFNTMFVLGLDQDQFLKKLTEIYATRDWPNFDVLAAELHTYVESTERIKYILKVNNDGKIKVNWTSNDFDNNNEVMCYEVNTRCCWNCLP
jgi:hypothetical protein